MDTATTIAGRSIPWNKGKLLGQKPPLKLKELWAIRIRLQLDHRARELALFNLAIDSKLGGCDRGRRGILRVSRHRRGYRGRAALIRSVADLADFLAPLYESFSYCCGTHVASGVLFVPSGPKTMAR
jgi:hypothetical protein